MADKGRDIMPSQRLSLSPQVLSKSVFNSLYAMVKSRSCVQSLSRFQSNLRVISKAFHSILSFPCIWLAGRPASGGRLLNCFLVSLLARAPVFSLGVYVLHAASLELFIFSFVLLWWTMWVYILHLLHTAHYGWAASTLVYEMLFA